MPDTVNICLPRPTVMQGNSESNLEGGGAMGEQKG